MPFVMMTKLMSDLNWTCHFHQHGDSFSQTLITFLSTESVVYLRFTVRGQYADECPHDKLYKIQEALFNVGLHENLITLAHLSYLPTNMKTIADLRHTQPEKHDSLPVIKVT